jgi:hypothetical protein
MRAKILLIAGTALALALPALAQQQPVQPGQQAATAPSQRPAAQHPATARPSGDVQRPGYVNAPSVEGLIQELTSLELPPPPEPVEYPPNARRNPWVVGVLDPAEQGLGDDPWRGASGAFLSTLMRRMDTPIASRWAHIGLRQALLAKSRAPRGVNPVDWTAERAWLLLRMGEADAGQMLIAGVDTDQFTPKMFQVAVQGALASADVPALCPIEDGIRKYEARIRQLVVAMCSSLAGEPESAAAQIDDARRHGRIGGIDLTLADKVVGAGANTGRAVTIEWDPVDQLTAWRFGLATATGMAIPDRLLRASPPRLRAYQARAALLPAPQRLDSALIAAGLGVLSSQSLVDLYSSIYDSTDPGDLPSTDAWQLRQAFVGADQDARVGAIRHLLGKEKAGLQKEGIRALVARAATRIDPDPKLESDAPELISAMFAAGYDRAAARWAHAVGQMDDANADRAWAMLVLGAPDTKGLDLSYGRISGFIGRDDSPDKVRSSLLVAGLFGLGRINEQSANSLNRRNGLGLGRRSTWTRMTDGAARLGQSGTVMVLAGTGLQTQTFDHLPGAHLYHALDALRATHQDFIARMIAAEALSRT